MYKTWVTLLKKRLHVHVPDDISIQQPIWYKRFLSKKNLFSLKTGLIKSGILYIKVLCDDKVYSKPLEHFAHTKNYLFFFFFWSTKSNHSVHYLSNM